MFDLNKEREFKFGFQVWVRWARENYYASTFKEGEFYTSKTLV
jgi:hypothetical protein